jgi:nucleotide-binding universal stress UspA family protein
MTPPSSVLCAIDFSPHAERALRHAAALTAAWGARLTLITVADPLLEAAAEAAGRADQLRDQAQQALRDLLVRVWPGTAAHPSPPAVDVAIGDPATRIVAAAADCGAQLIVLGTEGKGGAERLVLGSTAARVLRTSPVPVLAVPSYAPDRMRIDAAGPRFSVGVVMVAVGFDEGDDDALVAVGRAWAGVLGARLALLHVLAPIPAPAGWETRIADAQMARDARARAALTALARHRGDAPAEAILREGAFADELRRAVDDTNAGLLVIGAGHGAYRLGTTAYRAITAARVPVVVIPRGQAG